MLSSFRPRIALADISAICVTLPSTGILRMPGLLGAIFRLGERPAQENSLATNLLAAKSWRPQPGDQRQDCWTAQSDQRLSDRIVRPWSLAAFLAHGLKPGHALIRPSAMARNQVRYAMITPRDRVTAYDNAKRPSNCLMSAWKRREPNGQHRAWQSRRRSGFEALRRASYLG